MNIALLYPIKEKEMTGVRNLTKGIVKEILEIDTKNNYYLLEEQYFDSDIREQPLVRWGGTQEKYKKYDFQCYCKKIDILHSYWDTFEGMKSPCKKILTIHDLLPIIHPEWHTLKEYFEGPVRQSALLADCIIANSEYTKADIVKYFGISSEKIRVVYPGLLHSLDFENADSKLIKRFHIEDHYILSVCTIEPRKNLRGLVNGYILYKHIFPDSKMKLVIAGRVGWDYEFEKDIDSINEFKDDIILTEFVSDVELAALYKNAYMVAYVSFYEGFGLPILEAMSAGKAVIASNTTSMPEVGGDAVLYCNPYEITSIADAITKLATDDNYKRGLERAGKIQAAKFSYRNAALETIKIYADVMGE